MGMHTEGEPGRRDAVQRPATVHTNKKELHILEEEQKDKEIAQHPRHQAEKNTCLAAADRRSTGMRMSTKSMTRACLPVAGRMIRPTT